ncbi:MAG: NusG domain II-containing protein [Ruminococcaceae bacterium]|nr:NusG domain II-containing protein [Oscillospiraceae bacterium]
MNKRYIIAVAALTFICIAGIAAFIIMKNIGAADPIAEIYVDGKLFRTATLSQDCEFTISTEHGTNTIKVENGAIAVVSADCPDKVCVNTGAISSGIVPIICLPHRLEIRVISAQESSLDAVIS